MASDPQQIAMAILPMVIILGMGTIVVVGARAVGLSPIIGYLALGLAIGRWSPELLSATSTVHLLAELGVAFLLFDIGLHFSVTAVRRDATDIFAFGPLQVVGATAVLAVMARLSGQGWSGAFLVGGTLALSSTAVVGAIIAERHQRTRPVGTTATSILVFQDVAAIFLLIVTTALASGGALPILAGAAVKTALAIALVVVAQRVIVRPLFAILSRYGREEVFTSVTLVVAMAAGWMALVSGLSLTLGAFLGGMIFADTPFRALVRSEIAPFRNLLIGFFFISVGASIDLGMAVAAAPAILAVAIGLMTIKSATNAAASLVFRWSVPGSLQLGILLSQGSEFTFVILAVPEVRMLIGDETVAILTTAVTLTLALTPPVSDLGRRLAGRLRARRRDRLYSELRPGSGAEPILIIGMGRVGRTVADALTRFGIGYDAVDRDGERLSTALADGYRVFFGNADDPGFWHSANMTERRFSLNTAGDPETALELEPVTIALFPTVRHVVVVHDALFAERVRALGAEAVVERSGSAGLDAARYLLEQLDVGPPAISAWVAERPAAARDGSHDLLPSST